MTYLKNAYAAQRELPQTFEFRLISTGEIADAAEPARNTLTVLLYRVTQETERPSPAPPGHGIVAPPPLALALHYLLTAWADDALMEQTVLTWAMREIQMHPVLDRSDLSADAGWISADAVQLIPAALSLDELSRIWDLLHPKYRLSAAYTARVVRIDEGR